MRILEAFDPPKWDLQISGGAERTRDSLSINFEISGDLEKVLWENSISETGFCDKLWEHTCFEFFCGSERSSSYLEFNATLYHQYAVYFFNDYRKGCCSLKESGFKPRNFSHEFKDADFKKSLKVAFSFNLKPIIAKLGEEAASAELKLGLSVVIKQKNEEHLFFSLSHPSKKKPDFHDRHGFILKIPKR